MEYELVAQLAVALMQEGRFDLDEEVLACALMTFLDSLPESTQEEIKRAIHRFTTCPDGAKLREWKQLVSQ